jgi:uncharacterized membrane protein YeaQ/YmgE (transglycosylase-associated protein family)
MIGMSFLTFLVLLGIGGVVAGIFHYALRYRVLEGIDALYAKVAIAWIGAWLGSPVLGYWSYKIENVCLAPAILGAITALVLNGVGWKAAAKVFSVPLTTQKSTPPSVIKAA